MFLLNDTTDVHSVWDYLAGPETTLTVRLIPVFTHSAVSVVMVSNN